MSTKPFIIRARVQEPMLPTTSEQYDEVQENRIQLVQAINGYLVISMLYESFKLMWSFWHYQQSCASYAYLSLGFMVLNLLWALTSYLGFKSIRSKNSRNITLFGYSLIGNFLLRLTMYVVCGVVMSGYSTKYIAVTPEELNSVVCNALYPQALYVIEGIIEALLCLFVMFLVKGIYIYVRTWEKSELQKIVSQKCQNTSHY